jgi:hypothetical protein
MNTITQTTEIAVASGMNRTARRMNDVSAPEAGVAARQAVIAKLGTAPLYLLIYDIPEALNSECPNPSPAFWGHGFRLNKSCWVMSAEALESDDVQAVLRHWDSIEPVQERVHPDLPYTRAVGVEYHTIEFAASQVKKIQAIARRELERFLVRIHTSLIERMFSAEERLRAAEAAFATRVEAGDPPATEQEQAALQSRYDSAVRALLRDAQNNLVAALESAQAFDTTEDLADLFRAVRAAVAAELTTFNARMVLAGRRQVEVAEALQAQRPAIEPRPALPLETPVEPTDEADPEYDAAVRATHDELATV